MRREEPLSEPFAIAVLCLTAVFYLLGIVFLSTPGWAASIYGFPTAAESALFYVRAIGVRDLALASYIFTLLYSGQRKGLALLLAITPIIPLGDVILLGARGDPGAIHYALHGLVLLCFATLAVWARLSLSGENRQ